ncbi:ABC transporter ATP-binding protein [Candidatus Cyanaurora vandensis]|uniref:ABC transporter ATP-binding protein n=1 Tax=Candidatus Cyanaurora vandensis TaxID=2714958 RepID=UPI00257CA2EB|nr:ABC transporter ATP-binding protein [Candidatus Cyanaurora vandensis]
MWAFTLSQVSKSFPVHLRLRDLLRQPHQWFFRPRQQVLAPLDLNVAQGSCLAVLGPNGAGKTTLTKLLALLLTPDQGQVQVLGQDSQGHSPQLRQKVAYVGTGERGCYDRLSARENLNFFATLYQVPLDRIEPVLAQVGLSGAMDKPLQMYSSGMRQRFALARALLVNPQILLLDEPTRGIDPTGCQELYTLIEDLRRTGITVVLCTQVLAEAERLGEQFLFLQQGRVLAQGNLAQIAQTLDLKDRVTVELTQLCHPQDLALPWTLLTSTQHPTGQLTFRVEQDSIETFQQILQGLRGAGLTVRAGAIQPPTLETIYTALVEGR